MILRICPACGVKFEGDLCLGCPSCGARAVGPPLAKAERELPSWGRAFIVAATGVALLAMLIAASIVLLVQTRPLSVGLDSIRYAGESAAWNLKWIELPLFVIALWVGARLVRSIRRQPDRFIGLRMARAGLMTSVIVAVTALTLVGVTVPDRLVAHRDGLNAAGIAKRYTIKRALLEYRELHKGAFPADIADLLKEVPDPDGTIAEALRDFDPNGYKPSSVVAAASTKGKSQSLRGGALLNAPPTSSSDQIGVSFTNYELRFVGEDKILYTDDDVVLHDGVFDKVSDISQPNTSSARPSAP